MVPRSCGHGFRPFVVWPVPGSDIRERSGSAADCTTPLHKTHGTAIGGETTVIYVWHPWSGRTIRLHEVIERTAGASARCSLVDAPAVRVQELPVWMLDTAVCRLMRSAAEAIAGLDAFMTLGGLLRDAMQRTAADAVANAGVASPESRGECHVTTLSSVPKAASTTGPAFGGSRDAGCGAPLEQLAGSDPPGAERPSHTTDGGARRQRRSAASAGRRR